jgi:hypothetical protein
MKIVIGPVPTAVGVAFGMLAGIWWCFIGGVVDVIREIRVPELDAPNVATGIAKAMDSFSAGLFSR